jgi:hypothetical protein
MATGRSSLPAALAQVSGGGQDGNNDYVSGSSRISNSLASETSAATMARDGPTASESSLWGRSPPCPMMASTTAR